MHGFEQFFGLTNASGMAYLFWSGIVGDLALLGAVFAVLRKINCEQHGCWRVGRHDTAAGHTVCRSHHPDGHLTAQDIHSAHKKAKVNY